MDAVAFLGYLGALAIGLVLGLIGGGGSILTVPVLVYLLHFDPVTATAYSLFVVGSASFVGTLKNLHKGTVGFKTAVIFSSPAVVTVFITRKYIIPAIPNQIISVGDFILTKEAVIMVFFAVMMLVAASSMILDFKKPFRDSTQRPLGARGPVLAILGLLTGLFTGLVGAGGGFIIIPILIVLARLSIKKAVATSLFIIAINSLLGFLGDVGQVRIDWIFLLSFTGIAVMGIFMGIKLNTLLDGKRLKNGFGWFVLLVGIYILSSELFM